MNKYRDNLGRNWSGMARTVLCWRKLLTGSQERDGDNPTEHVPVPSTNKLLDATIKVAPKSQKLSSE